MRREAAQRRRANGIVIPPLRDETCARMGHPKSCENERLATHLLFRFWSVGGHAAQHEVLLEIASQNIFDWRNRAEKSMLLTIGAGSEVKSVGRPRPCSAAKGNRPQPVDCDRKTGNRIEQATLEMASYGIKYKDLATAELPYQNVVAIGAKVGGRLGKTPRRIEPWTRFQATQQTACGREDIDVSHASSVNLIVLCAVLPGIGNV
jgi:hypothetical protein